MVERGSKKASNATTAPPRVRFNYMNPRAKLATDVNAIHNNNNNDADNDT